MENFFNWMVKPVPDDEVTIWFNINNMHYEKMDLFGDILKSLFYIIDDTYLGNNTITDMKIDLSYEDKQKHFDWSWDEMINDFKKENIIINSKGGHKDYVKTFFLETFYSTDVSFKENVPLLLLNMFDHEVPFSKSDLEILTEIYKLFDKNIG